MSCNNCYNPSCDSTCGCPQQVKGTCVFYQGANLNCLDVTKGDTYDSILVTLNDLICNLNPPSGIATVVTSVCPSGSITVTNPSANVYNVCLSTATQTQINNNTTSIAALSACLTNTVANITTDGSITIGTTSGPCGKTFDLSVPTPSGTPIYDGIVYNNLDKSGTSGGIGTKLLKSFNWNYTSNNKLDVGDEIRFASNGQILGDGFNVDVVVIQLFDATGSTLLSSHAFGGFDKLNKQSWYAKGVLSVIDGTTGLLSLEFLTNSLQNSESSNLTSNSQLMVSEEVIGIDYSNLTIRIQYGHNSTSGATDNYARQLMVEVRKILI